jgi:hypothetical protein
MVALIGMVPERPAEGDVDVDGPLLQREDLEGERAVGGGKVV